MGEKHTKNLTLNLTSGSDLGGWVLELMGNFFLKIF